MIKAAQLDPSLILPYEIVIKILLYLPSIAHLQAVSKSFRNVINSNMIWTLILHRENKFKEQPVLQLSKEYVKYSKSPRLMFKELCLLSLKYSNPPNVIEIGIVESTRDHRNQSIGETIDDLQTTFWSSKGSEMDVDEFLDYQMISKCLITRIEIKPFLAQFQSGLPCYAPRCVSFSVGCSQDEYHFHSKEFPMINTNKLQVFEIEPQIGKYVRVNLIGKVQTQPLDDLYYTCLEKVEILGIPVCKSVFQHYTELQAVFQNWALDRNESLMDDDYNLNTSDMDKEALAYDECTELLKQREFDKVVSMMFSAKKQSSKLRSPEFLNIYESFAKEHIKACELFFNYAINRINGRERFTHAEALLIGLMFEQANPEISYVVYRIGGIAQKEFEMLIKAGKYDQAAVFVYERFANSDYHNELARMSDNYGLKITARITKTLLTFEVLSDDILDSIMTVFEHDNHTTFAEHLLELSQ
ncbi:hypothetical protein HDV01_005340 [Terramyces sp. JEL0728]|nr:hypothetical protein HDV01_005322 [Terramyces sp. JEL0728]KAJ3272704.1 hypothetical protein HDV01_005340 [Terramyces sp. JEL0728]